MLVSETTSTSTGTPCIGITDNDILLVCLVRTGTNYIVYACPICIDCSKIGLLQDLRYQYVLFGVDSTGTYYIYIYKLIPTLYQYQYKVGLVRAAYTRRYELVFLVTI